MSGACNTCGSRKHTTEQCAADVNKIQCFKCQKHGISKNCQERSRGSDGKVLAKRVYTKATTGAKVKGKRAKAKEKGLNARKAIGRKES